MSFREDESIKYIGIANFNKQSILVDYVIPSKKDKHSNVININKNINSIKIQLKGSYQN
jgi:hypothetical protein